MMASNILQWEKMTDQQLEQEGQRLRRESDSSITRAMAAYVTGSEELDAFNRFLGARNRVAELEAQIAKMSTTLIRYEEFKTASEHLFCDVTEGVQNIDAVSDEMPAIVFSLFLVGLREKSEELSALFFSHFYPNSPLPHCLRPDDPT